MKNFMKLVSVFLFVSVLHIASANAGAAFTIGTRNFDVSYSNFRTALTPYGSWVTVSPYGTVWRPTVVAGWTPYTNSGHLWYPVTNNYGQWVNVPGHGWIWAPAYSYHPTRIVITRPVVAARPVIVHRTQIVHRPVYRVHRVSVVRQHHHPHGRLVVAHEKHRHHRHHIVVAPRH